MYCPNCGNKLNGEKFCPKCGTCVEGNIGGGYGLSPVPGRKNSNQKLAIAVACGSAALVLILVLIFAAVRLFPGKEEEGRSARNVRANTEFEFYGYEFSLPENFSYDEEASGDESAVFEIDGKSAIFLYRGSGYSINGENPSVLLESVYDMYDIPVARRLGVLEGEWADPVAGMETVRGRVMMDFGEIWTVYICVNDDSELFYFILNDGTNEGKEMFESVLYETEEAERP